MRTDREKADDPEIEGPYKELAQEIRRLLGFYSDSRPLLSARQAALKSGVNHSTIANLVRGGRASRSSLRTIADVFEGNAEELIRLAGYSLNTASAQFLEEGSKNLILSGVGDGLSERIYHKIERLSERDLRRLEQVIELWVDDGSEIGQ